MLSAPPQPPPPQSSPPHLTRHCQKCTLHGLRPLRRHPLPRWISHLDTTTLVPRLRHHLRSYPALPTTHNLTAAHPPSSRLTRHCQKCTIHILRPLRRHPFPSWILHLDTTTPVPWLRRRLRLYPAYPMTHHPRAARRLRKRRLPPRVSSQPSPPFRFHPPITARSDVSTLYKLHMCPTQFSNPVHRPHMNPKKHPPRQPLTLEYAFPAATDYAATATVPTPSAARTTQRELLAPRRPTTGREKQFVKMVFRCSGTVSD